MKVNKYDEDEKNVSFNKDSLKKIYQYIKPYKINLIIVFVLTLILSILSFATVKILAYILDYISINDKINPFINLVLITLVIIIVYLIINYFKEKILINSRCKIIISLKNALFTHMQKLSYDYYNSRPNGKILIRLTEYVNNISTFLTNTIISLISNFITLIVAIYFMITTDITLTLISLSGLIFFIIFSLILIPKQRKNHKNNVNKEANLKAFQLETVKGSNLIQSFNKEEYQQNKLSSLSNKFLKFYQKSLWLGNLTWVYPAIINNVITGLILIGGIYLNSTVGVIIAMINYSRNFYSPLEDLFYQVDGINNAIIYLERIMEMFNEEITINDSKNAKEIKFEGNISLKNVSFSYIKDYPVLENISMDIKTGEKIAIVGPTGTGKTTLINLIARIYEKDEGEIYFDETKIEDIKLSSLHQSVQIMTQDSYLFSLNIYDNLRAGNDSLSNDDIEKLCQKINIHELIMGFPNGYETILKNNGKELSLGERQLLCYARIIIANPKIIILDEATSRIDTLTEHYLNNSLNTFFKNKTIIMIAHRISSVRSSDRIYVLKDRQISEVGNHDDLMKKKGEYYKLYQIV